MPSLPRRSNALAARTERRASAFAALGDPTRLSLLSRLVDGKPRSISALTQGSRVTRQAITKHLYVLENAGLVSRIKSGRESLYELDPRPLESMQQYLATISAQWNTALNALKTFVEQDD